MIEKLVKYLGECDDAYYNTSNPLVSDDTYDALVESLRRLDPTNEYLKKVGAKVRSNKIGRLIPMGTLSKYHKEEEVKKWLASEGDCILLAPKYDGFAIELVYHQGSLIAASTRGEGYTGENVLDSVLRIKNVPINIPFEEDIIVRGEAIIPSVYHEEVKNLGYSAMRNAVPGIVRSNRKDALGYVEFIAYEFIDTRDDRVSQREKYKDTFKIEDYMTFHTSKFDDILKLRDSIGHDKENYDYEIDGVVLKTVIIKEDDLLNPSHMIAWKYKSNRETTVLREIEYSMGLTGYFTPIGIFDEVEFQGAKLTRASLGNITRMKKEFDGMTIGSLIEVSRRGDIIPYIEELSFIDSEGEKVEFPRYCPYCGELLAIDDKDDKWEPHCINKACPEKLRLQISQYAKSVGIKGIGDKLIRGLIDAGSINSIIDIYTIDPEVILSIPRQGQSSVDKWRSLQEKNLSQLEVLTAYPFIDLGEKVWKIILNEFSYDELLYISHEELHAANLKGIGESKIDSIVSQVRENRHELTWLGEYFNVL